MAAAGTAAGDRACVAAAADRMRQWPAMARCRPACRSAPPWPASIRPLPAVLPPTTLPASVPCPLRIVRDLFGVVLRERWIAVIGAHVVVLHAVPGDEPHALVLQHLRILELLRRQQLAPIRRKPEAFGDADLVAVEKAVVGDGRLAQVDGLDHKCV